MEYFCQFITPLFKGLLRCFVLTPAAFEGCHVDMLFVISYMRYTTEAIQRKPTPFSTPIHYSYKHDNLYSHVFMYYISIVLYKVQFCFLLWFAV